MQENRKITIIMFITLTAILTAISFFIGSRYGIKNMKVLYISQAEILNIEKARIASNPTSEKQLFFGKPEAAIKYIEQVHFHSYSVRNTESTHTQLIVF